MESEKENKGRKNDEIKIADLRGKNWAPNANKNILHYTQRIDFSITFFK